MKKIIFTTVLSMLASGLGGCLYALDSNQNPAEDNPYSIEIISKSWSYSFCDTYIASITPHRTDLSNITTTPYQFKLNIWYCSPVVNPDEWQGANCFQLETIACTLSFNALASADTIPFSLTCDKDYSKYGAVPRTFSRLSTGPYHYRLLMGDNRCSI